ncbi:hypothetical protein [Phycicoccus avicenniae]|uniref:hypothetical protein n=1 Tax=Phycicoccus avicenniae TaxID=2828860 RepID=UPI003D27A668
MASDQGSPYEDPDGQDQADRRVREVALQRLLDDLTARLHGRPEGEVLAEVDRALAAGGFTDMPPRWREAVSSAVASGTPYVVSVDAAEERADRLDRPD